MINLSLGTSKSEHRALLEDAVARARTQGALIVSANDDGGVRWLPGCLDDVVAVRADWSCERGACRSKVHTTSVAEPSKM